MSEIIHGVQGTALLKKPSGFPMAVQVIQLRCPRMCGASGPNPVLSLESWYILGESSPNSRKIQRSEIFKKKLRAIDLPQFSGDGDGGSDPLLK